MSSFAHPFSIASQTAALCNKTSTSSSTTAASDNSSGLSTSLASSVAVAAAAASNHPIDMSAETLRILQSAGHLPMPPQFGGFPHGLPGFGMPGPGGGPPGGPGGALSPLDIHRLSGAMGAPFGLFPMPPEFKGLDGGGLPPHLMGLAGGGHPGVGGGGVGMPPQPLPGYYYDPMSPFPGPYSPYGGPLDLNGARRKNATRETTAALKAWLYEHRKNPYPTKGEKIMLAIITKMTLTQVSTWFANARRRLKKENKMTWSPRNRPGEDDDDDDIGAGDRPTSSMSDDSDILAPPPPPSHHHHLPHPHHLSVQPPPPHHPMPQGCPTATTLLTDASRKESNNNDLTNGRDANETSDHQQIAAKSSSSTTVEEATPAKKRKIWSIADTVATSSVGGADVNGDTTAVTEPSSSPSTAAEAAAKKLQQTSALLLSSVVNGDSGAAPGPQPPNGLPTLPPSNGGAPLHFSFNPWQQAAAAAAAFKSPLMSPNAGAGALMSPPGAGHFRPEHFLLGRAGLPNGGGLPNGMPQLPPPFSMAGAFPCSPSNGAAAFPAAALAGFFGQAAAFHPRMMFGGGGVNFPTTSSVAAASTSFGGAGGAPFGGAMSAPSPVATAAHLRTTTPQMTPTDAGIKEERAKSNSSKGSQRESRSPIDAVASVTEASSAPSVSEQS